MATLTRANPARQTSTLIALRQRDFRLYFFGQLVSNSGTWMQNIAQSYLVYQLTKSELWLGIVACAGGLPVLLMSPIGGVIVGRFPRRSILIFTQTTQMILAFILALLTFAGVVQVWHILLLAMLFGMTNALDVPARQTIVVELVGKEELYSGIALNSIMNSMGRVLGPMAAGVALVQFGAAWCFLINALTFVAVLFSLFLMKVPYAIKYISQRSPMAQLREGLQFSRRDPLIPPLLLLAAVAGLLLLPILSILPAYADLVLHSPEKGYAAISVAEGIGAVAAGIMVGWLSRRFGMGRVLVAAFAINGLTNVLLAFQNQVALAVLITSCFGCSMVLAFVCLNTTLQTVVPDSFRTRVLSLYSLAIIGFTPFGALALGWLADTLGIQTALIINGVLVAVLSGATFLRLPHLMHFRADETLDIAEAVVAAGD